MTALISFPLMPRGRCTFMFPVSTTISPKQETFPAGFISTNCFLPPSCFFTHFENACPLIPFSSANTHALLPLAFLCSSHAAFSSVLYFVILSSLTSSLRKVYHLFYFCPDTLVLTDTDILYTLSISTAYSITFFNASVVYPLPQYFFNGNIR
jgi:hypothetical protein